MVVVIKTSCFFLLYCFKFVSVCFYNVDYGDNYRVTMKKYGSCTNIMLYSQKSLSTP